MSWADLMTPEEFGDALEELSAAGPPSWIPKLHNWPGHDPALRYERDRLSAHERHERERARFTEGAKLREQARWRAAAERDEQRRAKADERRERERVRRVSYPYYSWPKPSPQPYGKRTHKCAWCGKGLHPTKPIPAHISVLFCSIECLQRRGYTAAEAENLW